MVKTRPGERLTALALLTLLAACDGDSGRFATAPVSQPQPAPTPAIWLEARVSSSDAVGIVGTSIPDHRFGVFVHDGRTPVSGVQIVWAVIGSGGSVTPTSEMTRNGESLAMLTLGPDEGTYTLTATAPALPGAPHVAFKATAVTLMVQVRDLADGGFVPASVTIPSGRAVGWRYDSAEGDLHNITFEDDPTRVIGWADIVGGRRYHTRTFEGAPRTIRYRCTLHSTDFTAGEVGSVTVQ